MAVSGAVVAAGVPTDIGPVLDTGHGVMSAWGGAAANSVGDCSQGASGAVAGAASACAGRGRGGGAARTGGGARAGASAGGPACLAGGCEGGNGGSSASRCR